MAAKKKTTGNKAEAAKKTTREPLQLTDQEAAFVFEAIRRIGTAPGTPQRAAQDTLILKIREHFDKRKRG